VDFENVHITSTRNGSNPITGWRQDIASGETIGLSLTNTAGVNSYAWLMVGRPEGSAAGGAGPEPVSLGTSSTASFVVDTDGAYPVDGTYIVHCVLNAGSPSQAIITVGLARLATVTTADGRPLRKLGASEVNEDTSVASRKQGYATMLDRWLTLIAAGGGGGGGGASVNCKFVSYTYAQLVTLFGHVEVATHTLFALPEGAIILGAKLLIAELFSTAGFSNLHFNLGTSGHNVDSLVSTDFDRFMAVYSGLASPIGTYVEFGTEDPAVQNIAAITLNTGGTGGFIDSLTAGRLNVYVYYLIAG
jgi:hypothetical protein